VKRLLLALALCPAALAQNFNGQPAKGVQIKIDCLDATIRKLGPMNVMMRGIYNLQLSIKNPADKPCEFEPYEFRIVNHEGKQHEVFGLGRFGRLKKGQKATLMPGAQRKGNVLFKTPDLDETKPAILYYKAQKLGEITK
jgi:hypothetical protein